MIKHAELNKAAVGCYEHIRELRKTFEFLYDNHKFGSAIFYTIIAIEEIGKLATYCDYFRKLKDLPDDVEEKLRTNHKFKLNQLLKQERERNNMMREQQQTGLYRSDINIEQLLVNHIKLNKIKQLALYYDYKKSNHIGLHHHFSKHPKTKKQLEHFCIVLMNLVYYSTAIEFLRHQYGNIEGKIIAEKIPQDDENYEILKNIQKNMKPNNNSIQIFQNVFLELIYLYDTLYKK